MIPKAIKADTVDGQSKTHCLSTFSQAKLNLSKASQTNKTSLPSSCLLAIQFLRLPGSNWQSRGFILANTMERKLTGGRNLRGEWLTALISFL